MKFESPLESPPPPPEPESPKKEPTPALSRRGFLKVVLGGLAAAAESSKLAKVAEAFDGTKETELETLQRDWEAFIQIAGDPQVKEDMDFLYARFGGAIPGLIFKVHMDRALIQDRNKIKQFSAASASESDQRLLETVSKTYRRFWNCATIDERIRERESREGLGATIDGFDVLPEWDNKKVRVFMERRFNPRWLYGNIGSFEYVDRSEERTHFRVAGTAHGTGIQSMLTKEERQAVRVYKHERALDEQELLGIIAHEIGHHQDWENSNRLPIHERLRFLREVDAEFDAPERFHSPYIDVDTPNEHRSRGGDEKVVRYAQVKEYWATLMEEYALRPDVLKRHHSDDYALAEKWYRRLTEPLAKDPTAGEGKRP